MRQMSSPAVDELARVVGMKKGHVMKLKYFLGLDQVSAREG